MNQNLLGYCVWCVA